MFSIPQIVFVNDITRLPKITLAEICTDLNLDASGSAFDLAQRVWEFLRKNMGSDAILNKSKDKLLAGQVSVTWFRFDDLSDAKGLITKNCGFNPFEQVKVPPKENLTTAPCLIAGSIGNTENEYYLRFMYKNGVRKEFYGTEMNVVPISEITTVYVNEELGIIEVRADSKKADKVASALARIIDKEITLEPVTAPFLLSIGEIADALDGKLIDTTSKPELILDNFGDDQAKAIGVILTALNNYFVTKDINVFDECLKKAEEVFDEQTLSIPFTALILAGMERVGLGGERELRGLPLYDSFDPFLDHQSGFVRFKCPEEGIEKTYTIRVGLKTKSIYFNTPATEPVIKFVRDKFILT